MSGLFLKRESEQPPRKQFGDGERDAGTDRPRLHPRQHGVYHQVRHCDKEGVKADAVFVEEASAFSWTVKLRANWARAHISPCAGKGHHGLDREPPRPG